MGSEARCTLTFGRKRADGKALLETDELVFRGADLRLSIPYAAITSLEVKDGTLRVTTTDGLAGFELGDAASKWAERIRNPPRRIDKLGIKPGQRVLLVGVRDESLREELAIRGATVVTRATTPVDVVFLAANGRTDLDRLLTIQKYLLRDGAIWVIRPKGSAAISERDVMNAGKGAGLVDVKVVRFSDTHTAEKFVIPVARR